MTNRVAYEKDYSRPVVFELASGALSFIVNEVLGGPWMVTLTYAH